MPAAPVAAAPLTYAPAPGMEPSGVAAAEVPLGTWPAAEVPAAGWPGAAEVPAAGWPAPAPELPVAGWPSQDTASSGWEGYPNGLPPQGA